MFGAGKICASAGRRQELLTDLSLGRLARHARMLGVYLNIREGLMPFD